MYTFEMVVEAFDIAYGLPCENYACHGSFTLY